MTIPELLPRPLRRLITKSLNNSNWFLQLAKLLFRLKIIDAFSLKYLQHNLGNPERRERLLKTWISIADFKINLKKIKATWKVNPELITTVVLGKRDPLIDLKKIQKKLGKHPNLRIEILDKGHQLIGKELAEIILK